MIENATKIWVGEVELSASLAPRPLAHAMRPGYASARLLVRLHGRVLGVVAVELGPDAHGPTDSAVESAVMDQLSGPLARHLEADGLPPDTPLDAGGLGAAGSCALRARSSGQLVSVVVCTRQRPRLLADCLRSLLALTYRNLDIIVVDNAPADDGTQRAFADIVGTDRRFRYVREPVPGLSRARNRGLHVARGRVVAFTDDDARADAGWIDVLAAPFEDPRVGCVTGLVPSVELEHPSQHYFDRRYSWASQMEPRVFDLDDHRDPSALYPYSPGIFGTGANFAVDRDLLTEIGGFDEALGAGSPAGGGEDLDAFVRVLQAGRRLVYDPSAIVWHAHRADSAALRRQLFFYGVGLTAFLTKHLACPQTRREVLRRLPKGGRKVRNMWREAGLDAPAPPELVAAEALGMVAGPLAYARGRWRSRNLAAG